MTARATPEWIGPRPETPAPPRVQLRIIDAQGGICGCGCGVNLGMCGEAIEFDHIEALINGGENREGNLQALRQPCHKTKTRADVGLKSRTASKRKAALGLKKTKHPLPGGRNSHLKRKVGGGVVLREDD